MPRIDAPTLAEHQARRRATLVDAAAHLLLVEGPSAVTPAAVAAVAGLARSSTYQYFPSTAALLQAAVEELFRAATERLALSMPTDGTPLERVTAYVTTSMDSAVSGHSVMTGLQELDLPAQCLERVHELHDLMTAGLRVALQEAGVADVDAAAALVLGLVSAAARLVAHGRAPQEVRPLVLQFVQGALATVTV